MPSILLWCPHCRALVGSISTHDVIESGPVKLDDPDTLAKLARKLSEFLESGDLSTRAFNCINNEYRYQNRDNDVQGTVPTIAFLVKVSEIEMRRWPNMGNKSVREVKELLASLGLHLGMDLQQPTP